MSNDTQSSHAYFGDPMSLQAHLFLAEKFMGARGHVTQGGVVFSIKDLGGSNHTVSLIEEALKNRNWDYALDEKEGTVTLTTAHSQRLAASFGAEFEGSQKWFAGGKQR